MKIDNSQANAFWFCPQKWQEVNQVGIQKKPSGDARDFGKAIHERLKKHFLSMAGVGYEYPPDGSPEVSNEADEMLAAYVSHYPVEDFDVVEVERYFEVPLPPSPVSGEIHTYCGKRDGVVRDRNTGRIRLLEHKSETRNSRNNLPAVWAARAQVSLYLYAGQLDYGEAFDDIILDVLTRRSPAGRISPVFRRDNLQRSARQIELALQDITYVADQITMLQEKYGTSPWPRHTENCCKMGFNCDFYLKHITMEGQHDLVTIEKYYVPTERYLDL